LQRLAGNGFGTGGWVTSRAGSAVLGGAGLVGLAFQGTGGCLTRSGGCTGATAGLVGGAFGTAGGGFTRSGGCTDASAGLVGGHFGTRGGGLTRSGGCTAASAGLVGGAFGTRGGGTSALLQSQPPLPSPRTNLNSLTSIATTPDSTTYFSFTSAISTYSCTSNPTSVLLQPQGTSIHTYVRTNYPALPPAPGSALYFNYTSALLQC